MPQDYEQHHSFQGLSRSHSTIHSNGPASHQTSATNHPMKHDAGHNQANKKEIAKRIKYVAYGGKAAFQVEQSVTKDGRHTIMVESATKIVTNDPNDKRYAWTDKISFQLSPNKRVKPRPSGRGGKR